MSINIKNMPLNSDTARTIANKVMKDKNMRVTKSFVPATSDYVINLSKNNRVRMHLEDNYFSCVSELKLGDNWFLSGLTKMSGDVKKVEDCFIKTVSEILKKMDR